MRPKGIPGMVKEAAACACLSNGKKTMGKKKHIDEITALLAEEIMPKLDMFHTKRRAFIQYQKATTELERLVRVLRAYKWTDSRKKASRKDAQISQWEQDVVQACRKKERATRDASVAENNWVNVQTQRDRALKKGCKVTRMEDEAKQLEKAVIKLRTQAEIKEGSIKDEIAAWDASAHELSEVRTPLILSPL